MKPVPIHIAFCVNNGYVPYISVTIQSIIDSHKDVPVTVHILSDDITSLTRRRLAAEFDDAHHLEIEIHDVDDSPLNGLKAWSKYTWYRLLLPSVLPEDIDKVLYLDADTLVCSDLTSLFDIDLKDNAVAGVIDPMHFDDETYQRCGYDKSKGYLCAGVMLVNLKYWREHSLQEKMIEWGLANVDIKFHDQDCINYICQDNKIALPIKYGVVDALYTRDELYTPERIQDITESIEHPVIVHYAGKAPWLKDAAIHPLSDLWHACNNQLRRKAKRSYKAMGILKYKIIIHDLLHPGYYRRDITKQEIKDRIIKARIENDK